MKPCLHHACLLAAALLAGCASSHRAPDAPRPAASLQCSELATEIAQVDRERQQAVEQQQGAWKAVIPFAVAARYAGARSDVGAADERLVELRGEFANKGCAIRG